MLHSSVLGLLLACAVSISSAAVILENGKPVLWDQAVSQVTEMPIVGNAFRPDPWNYIHRMSLYKTLMAATDLSMLYMGEGKNQSPFWGLPLQLVWMLVSGRLAHPTGATTCGMETGDRMCISTDSWWGSENYMVSVLPFLSAANNSIFGEGVQVQMQEPEGVAGFCTTYSECSTLFPDAMAKWDALFQGLINIGASAQSDAEKKDAVLFLFWEAQMASVLASAAYDAKKNHYSNKEVSFMNVWLNSTQYVAAAHFQSSLDKASKFISPLPSQILQDDDAGPGITGLTDEEINTLKAFSWMDSLNNLFGGALIDQWKKAMCSVETREKGSLMLEQALTNPAYSSLTFFEVLLSMSGSCKQSEHADGN